MSRIHNHRLGWSLNISQPRMDVTMMGHPLMFYSSQPEITLDLEYIDPTTAQRIMELCSSDYTRGCPSLSSRSMMLQSDHIFSVSGINITQDEANDIARNGVHPLEVLLGPNGVTVRAVPVDMREFL